MLKRIVSSAKARSRFLFNKDAAKAMMEVISEMELEPNGQIDILGTSYRSVVLGNGVKVFGEYSSPFERRLFGKLVREKGLDTQDVRVVLNIAARYFYPHAGVGYQDMKWPRDQRVYFHPQHQSYAQEEPAFSEEVKASIKNEFLPRQGWNVLDIGAYLGLGTLRLAEMVGEEGRVISVEAKKENFEVLKRHLSENEVRSVHAVFAAIWRESGVEMNLTTSRRQANALDSEIVSGKAQGVQTISIPDLAKMFDGPVNLVSLTVNGAEVEAMEGLQKLDHTDLPERILAPGWYQKDNVPRSALLSKALKNLGYRVEVTQKGMVFAWFD